MKESGMKVYRGTTLYYDPWEHMKRLEVVEKFLGELIPRREILKSCPGDFLKNEPIVDRVTEQTKSNKTIGCRGISCKECWNREVPQNGSKTDHAILVPLFSFKAESVFLFTAAGA